MKSGKRQIIEEIELPNQNRMRTLGEKETYKYLGILEVDTIKQVKMKRKFLKEYLRRTRKLLETKFCRRNLIKGINTGVVSPCKILWTILKMDKGRTQTNGSQDKKTNEGHVSKKEGRELPSIEDSVNASIQWLEDSIKRSKNNDW